MEEKEHARAILSQQSIDGQSLRITEARDFRTSKKAKKLQAKREAEAALPKWERLNDKVTSLWR